MAVGNTFCGLCCFIILVNKLRYIYLARNMVSNVFQCLLLISKKTTSVHSRMYICRILKNYVVMKHDSYSVYEVSLFNWWLFRYSW